MAISSAPIRVLAVLILAVLVCCHAQAAFDLAAEFDASNNPSTLGPWRYGSTGSLGGGFSIYTTTGSDGPIAGWSGAGGSNVTKNFSNSVYFIGSQFWGPGEAAAHPGISGEYAVFRFTTPAAGVWDIDSSFHGVNGAATTDVHVLINNLSIFDGYVSPGGGDAFSTLVPLALLAGNTIDFAVGFGGNGWSSDATGVSAQITAVTAVPEINAFVVIAFGAACIGALGKARRMRYGTDNQILSRI